MLCRFAAALDVGQGAAAGVARSDRAARRQRRPRKKARTNLPRDLQRAAWAFPGMKPCACRSMIACAASASALSQGNSGISLSHSTSVVIGPYLLLLVS